MFLSSTIFYNKDIFNKMNKKYVSTRDTGVRNSSGIGYVICKATNDAERKSYIKNSIAKGTITICLEDGGFIENVRVGKSIWNFIEFPKLGTELGSCVLWLNIPKRNEIIVTDVLPKTDELNNWSEDSFVLSRKFSDGKKINNYIEVSGNAKDGVINISVSGSENLGKLKINIANKNKTASLDVNVKGKINLVATDDIELQNNTIIYLSAKQKVVLGKGESPMIIGDIFKALLDDFIDAVSDIKTNTAIGIQPIINIAQVKLLKTRTKEILSKYGFLK